MASERSIDNHYVSLLLPAFRKHADQLLFRPYVGRDDYWESVTYREVEQRMAVAQAHWKRVLAPLKLKPFDIIGFWLTGRKFSDLINSIAVSSLGYTIQFFGGYFSKVDMVLELLERSGGKALFVDAIHAEEVLAAGIKVSHFIPLEYSELSQLVSDTKEAELVFAPQAAVGPDDLAVLFHSSGTTGGLPKIIPNTYKMLRAVINYKWPNAQVPQDGSRQVVVNTLGNMGHIGSFHTFIGSIAMGSCVVQSSSMAMKVPEFVNMTRECGLNVLVLYATFLADLIRAARADPAVKEALQGLHQILHTGVALNKEEEEWAFENKIRITTSYGTTETGPMLRSNIGFDASSRLLRPIVGANVVFLPHGDQNNIRTAGAVALYEMVVPTTADDCPTPEFWADDGFYHTNDLFEKIDDGYVYRGRAGDWIKVLDGFCDTKAVEDHVRQTCKDLVYDAVVVGNERRWPCLVVESADGLTPEQKSDISQTIVERTADFYKNLFPHEVIQDPRRVLVADKGTLPRTKEKGNIRRAATEEMFEKELDAVSERTS
ncbi:acetyl-CoA synthetase-like protein [Daedaleopsis nitida]|nr:acetyl-CoA synthetase-like protein [Daedaleopsis nitida]